MKLLSISRAEGGIALAAFVLAIALAVVHTQQPRSTPEDGIGRLFAALGSKSLAAVEAELPPSGYDEFVRAFGAAKRGRVQAAFDEAYRLAEPRWRSLRAQAHLLAAPEYEALRGRAIELGREAFGALSVEERVQLMDAPDRYEAFVFERGLAALPASEQTRLGTADDLRRRQNRVRFLNYRGFAALPPEDQSLVGGPEGFSDEETREKTALHDRIGVPLLWSDAAAEIGSITREEMLDPATFDITYGTPLAAEFLSTHDIRPDPEVRGCSFPRASFHGSLIRGDEALCEVLIGTPSGPQPAQMQLIRRGFAWRVHGVTPTLTDIPW